MAAERVIRVKLLVEAPGAQQAGDQAAGALDKTANSAEKSSSSLSNWANKAKLAVVGGAALAGAAVLNLGLSYEKSLNTLQAVTGATADEMAKASDVAKQLGNDISIPGASASDAAEAITELAKGGLTLQQSLTAARGTLQLASAAQISGAEAATIQADALNAFNLEADEAGHVADVLANAANAATGEISDFGQGLAQSSAVAHSMGVSLDDTTTVLGLFANAGVKGSDAGTSFKTMLQSLQNPTDKAQAALEDLGITVYDQQGNFVGMRTVVDELAQAKGRMSQADFNAAASTVFGSDAVRGAQIVAEGGVAAYDAMAESVGKVGGAQELAAAQAQGVVGAFGNLQNTLENVALSIYESAAPALEAILNGASGLIGVITELPTPLIVAAAALGAVALARGPLDSLWTSIKTGAATASTAIATTGATSGIAARGMAIAGVAAKGLGTSLKAAFLSNPIGLAIVGITTALSFFMDTTEEATPPVTDFTAAIDAQTGALNDNAQAQLAKALADSGSLELAQKLGVAADVYTGALLGNADNIKQVNDAIAAGTVVSTAAYNDYNNQAATYTHQTEDAAAVAAAFAADQAGLATGINKAQLAIEGAGGAAVDAVPGIERFAEGLNFDSIDQGAYRNTADMAAAIGDAAAGSAPSLEQMEGALDEVGGTATETDTKLQYLKITLDALNGVAPDTEAAARAAQAAIRSYAETYQDQAAAARGVQEATDAVTQANIDLTEAQDKKVDSDYSSEQKALDVAAAARDVESAQDAVTVATNNVSDASDDLFDAGQQVYQSFLQQSQAAYDTAVANGDLAGAQEATRAKAQQMRDDFIKANTELYGSAEAAGEAATALGLIPEQVATTIQQAGATDVELAAARVKAAIEAIPTSRTIAISYRGPATGGVVGLEAAGDVFQGGQAMTITAAASGLIRSPQMARGGSNILWAEGGDESYIPHAASMRTRSNKLMSATADILGGQYIPAGQSAVQYGSYGGGDNSAIVRAIDKLGSMLGGGGNEYNIQAGDSVAAVYDVLRRVSG